MSNLKQFKAEVSGLGAEACLPKNLPEYWFQYISNSLDGVIEDGEDMAPEALMLVLEILMAKGDGKEVSFSFDQMFEYFQQLRFEFAVEELNRSKFAEIKSATLETIFTNRIINVDDVIMIF